MSPRQLGFRTGSRWVPALLLVVAAAGIAFGWWMQLSRARSFAYVYAVLSPALLAALCAQILLSHTSQRHRWRVPALLGLAIAAIATHPHVPALSALSITAAAVAVWAGFQGRKAAAVAGTVIACVALSASLLLGLAHS